MRDLTKFSKKFKLFRPLWRDLNPLRKEFPMQHKLKRKTGSALHRKSRLRKDFAGRKIHNNDNLPDFKWQHLRLARRFGVSISHAKLICSLAGIGGAAND